MEVGLSLGSCLGDRLAHLRAARRAVAALPGVREVAASAIYETEPVGVKAEFAHLAYLNAVLILESGVTPEILRAALGEIETRAGRVRGADRFAPRTLDIDILYAGAERHATPALTVPHPRWAERRFVVQPLADVRPDLVLPGSTRTVAAQLAALSETPAVRLFTRDW